MTKTVDHFGNGVNIQPSYFNDGNVTIGWSLMKQNAKIKTVRIEIEPDRVSHAKTWIREANRNGYAIIATYHKWRAVGSDEENELLSAAAWWKNNYSELRAGGSFTVNLMNEWGSHKKTAADYAASYNKAIHEVRSVYGGRIVIDCPGWGQAISVATAAVTGTGGVKIEDTRIILSVHVYPTGWNQAKNRWLIASDLDELVSTGKPCIIGEFGSEMSGQCDWLDVVKHAKTLGWPLIGWAWNGDGGNMNMVAPSWSTNASDSSYSKSGYWNTIYDLL